MTKLCHRVLILLICAFLPATHWALAAAPAEAATLRKTFTSHSENLFVALASKSQFDAMNNSGTVLNYAKLATVFTPAAVGNNGVRARDWRRQFAAGAREMGARITNIATTESAAVDATRNRYFGCGVCRKALRQELHAEILARQRPCTNRRGVSKFVSHPRGSKYQFDQYFDSCDTNAMISTWSVCGTWAGAIVTIVLVGAAQQYAAMVTGVATIMCGAYYSDLTTAAANSDKGAVILRKLREDESVRGGKFSYSYFLPQ